MGGEAKDWGQALAAVLRVATRHPHLLDREAFDELEVTLRGYLDDGRLTVLVPDGRLSLRVYAMSAGPAATYGFGGRVPGVEESWQRLFVEGKPHGAPDMRAGNEIERAAASRDMLSYVAIPCRLRDELPRSLASAGYARGQVVAVLAVTFGYTGGPTASLIDGLQEIADLLAPSFARATVLARDKRLALILDTSSDAMLAWDRDGSITDCNAAAERLTGRSRDELLKTRVAELLDPIPGGGRVANARFTLSAGKSDEGEPRRIPVAVTLSDVENDARVAAHALLRDLTAVAAAENQAAHDLARIHELEEQHRTLLDNAPVIIFRLDAVTHELVYLNHHAERLLGVPMAEALSTPAFLRSAHADPDGAQAFDAAVRRAAEGEPAVPYEARLARRGGEGISVRGSVYPLVAERGRVAAIEGVLADVSAEQAARARLVEADRLSTLGTLAAGVAHEINNPAAFMLLGLDVLGRQIQSAGARLPSGLSANITETVGELRASIRRIVDIARDLRVFASVPLTDRGRRSLVDAKGAVESALSLTRGHLLERARLDQRLAEVPPVLMDEGRLGQVIVNLLVNAAQAIPKVHGGDHSITVATFARGGEVFIEIADTGVGIPREHLARIWEPFFTTKSRDAGTGLGLFISRQIVERARGTIGVESPYPAPGPGGTRFTIRLPAASELEEPSTQPTPPLSLRISAARARVLLVEDEPALARALAEEIRGLHDVVIAGDASDALVRLATDRFDVVLCDLRMPGMSGDTLYRRVRDRDPAQAARFVFMTGVGFGAESFIEESGRELLEKPFPASRALEAIARVMRDAAPR